MADRNIMPSAAEVAALLDYHPATGCFTSKETRGRCGRWPAGRQAGYLMVSGYRAVSIGGRSYYAHRLAWLLMTGDWPPAEIDHVNLKRDDNRWCNLRLADRRQNASNNPGHTLRRKGRLKGVTPHYGSRWRAQIMVNGKQIYLGIHATEDDAHAAYRDASIRLHGAFGRADSGDVRS